MSPDALVRFPQDADLENSIASFVRSSWASSFEVSAGRRVDDYERLFSVHAKQLDVIRDAVKGRVIYSRRRIPNVASLTARATPKGWLVYGPTRRDVLKDLGSRSSATVASSERTLLNVAYDRLINIHVVQMALSPIRNILVILDDYGQFEMKDLMRTGKPERQAKNYLTVLAHLGYLKEQDSLIVRGPRFPKGSSNRKPKEVYDSILAEVLDQDYHFLNQVLRLTQMIGYLRWSNAYYFTAFLADHKIRLPLADFDQKHQHYYPSSHRSLFERRGQMQRVLDSDVLVQRDHSVEGDPDITGKYFTAAKRAKVLSAAS